MTRRRSSSLGDHPVVERAPVVDLWIRAARRHGAKVVTVGPTGQIADGSRRVRRRRPQVAEAVEGLDRVALVWTGAAATGAELAAGAR